jgi:hypothetical protein
MTRASTHNPGSTRVGNLRRVIPPGRDSEGADILPLNTNHHGVAYDDARHCPGAG